MTLVLSFIHPPLVMHVGDRLVSEQTAAGLKEWDPLANKSVLVVAQNGYMCISYSGLAQIGGKPTDQWLAETATDRQIIPSPLGGLATLQDLSLQPRIGPMLSRIRAAIETDFLAQPPQYRLNGMAIMASGWVLRRRKTAFRQPRPFGIRWEHNGQPGTQVVVNELPRYWNWTNQARTNGVGQYRGQARQQFLTALQQPAGIRNQDDYETLMVDCIRTLANNHTGVGKHCMSIVIERQGYLRVRYLPDPATDRDPTSAYTPWVIGPQAVVPPQVMIGELPSLQIGSYEVIFERIPPLPPSNGWSTRGQTRRPFQPPTP